MREIKDTLRYIFKDLLLFSLPIVLVLGFPIAVFLMAREFFSMDEIVRLHQEDKPLLMGFAYSQTEKPLRVRIMPLLKPKVIIMSACKGMQLSPYTFKDPRDFFNAGSIVRKVEQYGEFIEQIPEEATPKVLITQIDYFNFDPAYRPTLDNSDDWSGKISLSKKEIFKLRWAFYRDLIDGKIDLKKLADNWMHPGEIEKFGLNAILHDGGYTNRGNYIYGMDKRTYTHYDAKAFLYVVPTASREPSEERIKIISDLLDFCKQRGIFVIGLQPPVRHDVYREAKAIDPDSYAFKVGDRLKALYESHGFEFYDFLDNKKSGFDAHEDEMPTSVHSSEKLYARIILKMTERGSRISEYVDADALRSTLKNSDPDEKWFLFPPVISIK